uniref:Uncharacterized protein n=1 Tax=Oryza meridionalis TaxID=40149 RepID=A0A0E0EY04_9ORYZ
MWSMFVEGGRIRSGSADTERSAEGGRIGAMGIAGGEDGWRRRRRRSAAMGGQLLLPPSLLALSPFSSVPSHGYARKAGEVWRRRFCSTSSSCSSIHGISCTVRRAKLTICLEGNQTNKVFQTIWNEKPDGTVQRDIKIQKGSTIRGMVPDTLEANSDFG